MKKLLIAVLTAMYILAVLCLFEPVLAEWTRYFLTFIGVVILIHVVEVVVFWPHIKRYQGQLVTSIFLTLLFGFLHWLPLKNKS